MKRASMTVSGMVQDVSFRYMVRHAAIKYRLVGKVKNREDGTVNIICEGEGHSVEEFVRAIRSARRPIEVDDIKIEYSEPTGQYKKFNIVLGDTRDEMHDMVDSRFQRLEDEIAKIKTKLSI